MATQPLLLVFTFEGPGIDRLEARRQFFRGCAAPPGWRGDVSGQTADNAIGGGPNGARKRDNAPECTASDQEAEAVHGGSRARLSADFGE